MRGTAYDDVTEWLDFDDQEKPGDSWKVHLNFLMSSWECIFGRGCPGLFPKDRIPDESNIAKGCCVEGFYCTSKKDKSRLEERIARMTPEDLGQDRYDYLVKHGAWNMLGEGRRQKEDPDPDYLNIKSRLFKGACIFAKQKDDLNDNFGCAFALQEAREKGQPVTEIDHTEAMPRICWQVPLQVRPEALDEEATVTTISAWDAEEWGGADEDGTHDSWACWWCVDIPDAYNSHGGKTPVYITMEKELRRLMGDANYDYLARLLAERRKNFVAPMPGAVRNEGRPMLPLIVESPRTWKSSNELPQ